MPPGQIDTHVGRPIENVPGLTIEERKRLVSWIDSGSPKDGGADPLADVEAEVQKFSLGEPDIVLEVPPQSIPATGVIDYRYVPVPLNLDEDVWISGMEFLPGDREVLHHVIAYLTSPADKTARASSAGSGQNIAGFARKLAMPLVKIMVLIPQIELAVADALYHFGSRGGGCDKGRYFYTKSRLLM